MRQVSMSSFLLLFFFFSYSFSVRESLFLLFFFSGGKLGKVKYELGKISPSAFSFSFFFPYRPACSLPLWRSLITGYVTCR